MGRVEGEQSKEKRASLFFPGQTITWKEKKREAECHKKLFLFFFYLDGFRGGAVEPTVLRDEQAAVLGDGGAALFWKYSRRVKKRE